MNLYDKLTFSYVNKLLRIGVHREINLSDFDSISSQDNCQDKSNELLGNWENNLSSALWKTFGYDFSIVGFGYFIEILFKIGEGFLLGRLLSWFQRNEQSTDGYLIAMGLVLTVFFHSLLRHIIFFNACRIGMQIRVTLTAAIYRKCLALSIAHTSSNGAIVNLISNDVQKFEDLAPWFHFIWVSPIELVLVWIFIYFEIGLVAFAPFITLGLMFPLQGQLARLFGMLRRKTVLLRDDWMKNVSDMMSGMMVVKLYGWEKPFIKAILSLRESEIFLLRKGSLLSSLNNAFSFSSPAILALSTFLTYHYTGGLLTASKVFTVITYLNTTRVTVVVNLPKGVQYFFETLVSLERIESFLSLREISTVLSNTTKESNVVVNIENGNFTWGTSFDNVHMKHEVLILKNINLSIKKGSLVAICGKVASGKTSLLNAILGEMDCKSGSVYLNTNKIAYASQNSWILAGSIRDNILFGTEYNEKRFKKVIKDVAFDRDFDQLPLREYTIVGDRGVTLSGGQRARLSLARALYSDADLFLLDDPLSAVDTNTSKHLFEKCIKSALQHKTVIIITHQIQYLPQCDDVILMKNGTAEKVSNTHSLNPGFLTGDSINSSPQEDTPPSKNLEKNHVIQQREELVEEKSALGSVSPKVYWGYFRSGASTPSIIGFLALMTLGQLLMIACDFWLARWSSRSFEEQQETFYPMTLLGLAVITMFFVTIRVICFFLICVEASRTLFSQMLISVSRSPMSFFQSNPLGRIMNRFSKDISTIDEMLPQTFFDFFSCAFFFIGALGVTISIIPYSILTVPFLGTIFLYLRKYYLAASRQIKRHEAVCRSPVYSHIPSTLEGLSVIRAFKMKQGFCENFYDLQNQHTVVMITFYSCVRWLGLRLDLLVTLFLAILSFSCIFLKGVMNLNPGLIGLLLSYLMALCDMLQWCVRQSTEAENMMVSTERVLEYSKLKPEAPEHTDMITLPGWPQHGEVDIKNLNLEYPNFNNNETNQVLKGITIKLTPGAKAALVGRTGAGKSSFLQALLRITEPFPSGCIQIDGVDVSKLGLFDLRSRISIIPQELFCFKGTIRFNLDPFGTYSDSNLWYALETVGLKDSVEANSEKLDMFVTENGSNLSNGERQLLCLARAMLKNSKLIVMDEPTSSIDIQTDRKLQSVIRTSGRNSTIITIAHRLETIIDYDVILVLEKGNIVEFGSPANLLSKDPENENAWFARMVQEMGPEAADRLKKRTEILSVSEPSFH